MFKSIDGTVPNVTVVYLSYNTKDVLRNALESLFQYVSIPLHVVVVDNGSSDGSQQMIREQFSQVLLIENEKNLGFAAGNNVALKNVSTEFVLLLNADTVLKSQFDLQLLLSNFEDETVAVVSPRIVLPSGDLDWSSHRGIPTPWNAGWYFLGAEKLFAHVPVLNRIFCGYHQRWKDINTLHEIDACTGAGMLIRSSAMQKVGLFDEDYFFYGEDLDWCYRFKKAGWKIVYDPRTELTHLKYQAGLGKKSEHSRAFRYFFDTMEIFYKKHYRSTIFGWFVIIGIRCIRFLKGAVHASK
ncbi:MAG: hypothetical protein A2378_02190 [Candidatus Pacebacteria bacterium RIFOXYB1_FULL_44_10]|nr:MAG: hypothetical protein A2378_02190 [Candidatus Pacebacteria bacterium RIFOXYB1_FULL_44_10]